MPPLDGDEHSVNELDEDELLELLSVVKGYIKICLSI